MDALCDGAVPTIARGECAAIVDSILASASGLDCAKAVSDTLRIEKLAIMKMPNCLYIINRPFSAAIQNTSLFNLGDRDYL